MQRKKNRKRKNKKFFFPYVLISVVVIFVSITCVKFISNIDSPNLFQTVSIIRGGEQKTDPSNPSSPSVLPNKNVAQSKLPGDRPQTVNQKPRNDQTATGQNLRYRPMPGSGNGGNGGGGNAGSDPNWQNEDWTTPSIPDASTVISDVDFWKKILYDTEKNVNFEDEAIVESGVEDEIEYEIEDEDEVESNKKGYLRGRRKLLAKSNKIGNQNSKQTFQGNGEMESMETAAPKTPKIQMDKSDETSHPTANPTTNPTAVSTPSKPTPTYQFEAPYRQLYDLIPDNIEIPDQNIRSRDGIFLTVQKDPLKKATFGHSGDAGISIPRNQVPCRQRPPGDTGFQRTSCESITMEGISNLFDVLVELTTSTGPNYFTLLMPMPYAPNQLALGAMDSRTGVLSLWHLDGTFWSMDKCDANQVKDLIKKFAFRTKASPQRNDFVMGNKVNPNYLKGFEIGSSFTMEKAGLKPPPQHKIPKFYGVDDSTRAFKIGFYAGLNSSKTVKPTPRLTFGNSTNSSLTQLPQVTNLPETSSPTRVLDIISTSSKLDTTSVPSKLDTTSAPSKSDGEL